MKQIVLLGLGLIALTYILATSPDADGSHPRAGKLRHVVLFKFKPTATPEQIKQVENAFRALPAKIPEIATFEWGTDVSPENLSQGFTHCFLLTFHDAAGRDAYLPHPAHKEFGKSLKGVLEKACVIDYVAKD